VQTKFKSRNGDAPAFKRHDDLFAETLTGWATNLLFPIPNIPNRYLKLPWRRILRVRGRIRGVLFIVKTLAVWPFELVPELLRTRKTLDNRSEERKHAPQFNHGDHICFLYRNEKSLRAMLARYVSEGLAEGEQCVCVESPHVRQILCDDLRSLSIDVDQEIAKHSLVFLSEEDVYFKGGKFDPEGLMKQLAESIDMSLRSGFTGFRIAGEVSHASGAPQVQKQLIDYEKRVDEYFIGKKAIGFCHYRLDAFPQQTLDAVVDAHALHLVEIPAT
jgi:MEDS: MEthanogen/methylotroph, DcmR Sensory domain